MSWPKLEREAQEAQWFVKGWGWKVRGVRSKVASTIPLITTHYALKSNVADKVKCSSSKRLAFLCSDAGSHMLLDVEFSNTGCLE